MFAFGIKSKIKLSVVKSRLQNVMKSALQISVIDFAIICGLRTKVDQAELVRIGASTTMDSKHLTGDAVDVMAYVKNKASWETVYYFKIALAVKHAAIKLGTEIRWGGVWDRKLNDLSDDIGKEVRDYCKRHDGRDFLDLGHFELVVDK